MSNPQQASTEANTHSHGGSLGGSFRSSTMLPINPHKRKQSGFTMLELMVAIVLIGIVAAIAIPSYTNMARRNKVANAQQAIMTMISLARSEATKRNSSIYLCPRDGSNSDPKCQASVSNKIWVRSGSAGARDSIMAYYDGTGDDNFTFDSTNSPGCANDAFDCVVDNLPLDTLPQDISVKFDGPGTSLRIRSDGSLGTSTSIYICDKLDQDNHAASKPVERGKQIVVSAGGSIKTGKASSC